MSSATHNRWRRLAILTGAINQLMENTWYKESTITSPTELDAALELSPIFQLNIIKPKEASLLHHIRVNISSIVRTFYNEHEKDLLPMQTYVQTLALVNAYYPLHIDLLAGAAVKH